MRNGFPDRLVRSAATGRATPLTMLIIGLSCLAWPTAMGREFVPFAIPARIDSQSALWMADQEPIPVDSQRLIAKDSHFYRGGERVRIWGVNLSFGANFPTHADAVDVATRLAAAGVNSVRCHHMDTSRWPRGIWNAQDGKTIEPEALDRLDYFINELAKRGIYVNINLHVGRAHSEYLSLPPTNRNYDKISGIFTPALVNAQKQYARDLLTHVNRYRNVRYADDPAVAFVEITNEDSFFMWSSEETLRMLPRYYARILRNQFNAWLRGRYGSDDVLGAAWAQGTLPLGENVLRNSSFLYWDQNRDVPQHWRLEQHEGCQASLSRPRNLPRDAIEIEIGNADDTEWHLQLTQGGFSLVAGQYYTVSFEASSRQPRQITCGVSQAHNPWGNLGFSRHVDLSADWKQLSFGFVATTSDTNARISFAFSGNATTFHLAHVELRPGGQTGLADAESLHPGNVDLFRENESTARILDRMIFLADTEKAYFDDMRSYVRTDLGCRALVTGTIVFGPLGLYAQSDMDFIDSHAYWQHPRFPGQPWDAGNWTIEQKPMTDYPDEATLFRLAAERPAGKPFTLSEYNHPAPMDAQAECVPMVASFAAAQDWDGVWLYTYSHSSDSWDREHMNSYFDIDTNPAKWGFMRAGAAIFDQDLSIMLPSVGMVNVAKIPEEVAVLAELHLRHGTNLLAVLEETGGITRDDMLQSRIIPSYTAATSQEAGRSDGSGELTWSVDQNGKGMYQAIGTQVQVYTGHAVRFANATAGRIRVTSPEFVALTITPLEAGTKTLVTACGRCENTGMQFSQDRRTVGRNWGQAPVQIEPVSGTIVLPAGRWVCHALAADGTPRQRVPVVYAGGSGTLTLSPDYETMWYLLEREME